MVEFHGFPIFKKDIREVQRMPQTSPEDAVLNGRGHDATCGRKGSRLDTGGKGHPERRHLPTADQG